MTDQFPGGMIALLPANAESLAVDGGDPSSELHLTLAYLGPDMSILSDEHRAALVELVSEIADPPVPTDDRPQDFTPRGVVRGEIWGHAIYNPGTEGAVVYLVKDREPDEDEVIEPGRQWIEDLHWRVAGRARDALGVLMARQFRSFEPHITAGRTADGVDVARLSATGPVTFDRIRLALGSKVRDFPLVGPTEGKAQSADPRARRLARWWAKNPKGRARWKPGTPGDYNRLRRALRAEVGPSMPQRVLDGLAANIHKMATGEWPGPKAHGKKHVVGLGEVKAVTDMDDDELMSKLDGYANMEEHVTVSEEDEGDKDEDDDDEKKPDTEKKAKGEAAKTVTTEDAYDQAVDDSVEWDLQPDGSLTRPDGDGDGDEDEEIDSDVEELMEDMNMLFRDVADAGRLA